MIAGVRTPAASPLPWTHRVVWVTHAATYPPRRGNQIRTAELLGHLGPAWRIDSVSLTIQRSDLPVPRKRTIVSPLWTDWRSRDPLSLGWMVALGRLGYPQVFSQHVASVWPHRRLRRLLSRADVVVVAPPYHAEWVRRHTPAGTPVVLDEHSIEADMYPPRGAWSRVITREIDRVERAAIRLADLVLVTSAEDGAACRARGAADVAVVPNGVDIARFAPVDAARRAQLRCELGLPAGGLAVFVGSGHPPNIAAVGALEARAQKFAAAGIAVLAVGRSSQGRPHVAGVIHRGEVVDVVPYLQAADVALCPLLTGSGTSLKTVEYLAAGLPLVSTAVGVRGLGVRDGVEAEVCDLDDFAARAAALVADPARAATIGAAARQLAEERYSWTAVGGMARDALQRVVKRLGGTSPAPTVLFVSAGAELYGSDLALERSIAALIAAGSRAVVAVARDGPLVERLRRQGARVEVLPLGVIRRRLVSPGGAVRIASALAAGHRPLTRLAREERVDLVHSNGTPILSGALAARVLGIPHVWHLREHLGTGARGHALARMVTAGADVIVAISDAVRDELVGLVPSSASHVRVIRDGVDVDRFLVLPPREEAAARLGVDPDRPVVAMLARLNRWKGQDVLLDAGALLRARGHRVQLLLAGDVYEGDEPIRAGLVARADALGLAPDLVLPGFLADPRDVLAVADIVAAPSTRPEPYGLAVVDALTAGRPVVASDAGGHRETVRDGVDGLLVPPGDAGALADALERLLADPMLRSALAGAASRDRHRFDAAPGAGAILALYAEVREVCAASRTAPSTTAAADSHE
jgi:glycosyltransferase involved in cell wall biosynthesis